MMNKIKFILLFLLFISCAGCLKAFVVSSFDKEQDQSPFTIDKEYFSIVLLPDTQEYTRWSSRTKHFKNQVDWIVSSEKKHNIKFVLQAGDLVWDSWIEQQWIRASESLSILDNNNIPYIINVGNHDLDGRSVFFKNRGNTNYDKYFPASRYENKNWYGGRMKQESNDNYWVFFNYKDTKFIVISIEFGANDETLNWADSIAKNNLDAKVIILTHCYMDLGSNRVNPTTLLNPHGFNLGDANDGNQIWNKLVKKNKNIFMVLSGHIAGEGRSESIGEHNNRVHEILANYQTYRNGGDGWLRLLRFVPSENKIYVDTYSPSLNKWRYDDRGSFVLDFEMN